MKNSVFLPTAFMLVTSLAYSSTQKMEASCSSETSVGVISQAIENSSFMKGVAVSGMERTPFFYVSGPARCRSQWPRGLMNCLLSLERRDRGFESHSRHGCLCVRLFCICVVLCVGSGLAMCWSLVQGVLRTVSSAKVELYIHSPIHLHGMVHN
jgi:ABC-type Fe3+-siderophore transport system permease subunit